MERADTALVCEKSGACVGACLREGRPVPAEPTKQTDAADIRDVEAQELQVGWDLFGAGVIERVVFTDADLVEVKAGEQELTFERDEFVTVRDV